MKCLDDLYAIFSRHQSDYLHSSLADELRKFANYYITCLKEISGKPFTKLTDRAITNRKIVSAMTSFYNILKKKE